jgi:hypothetical protein
VRRHTERRWTVAIHLELGTMVVNMVVKMVVRTSYRSLRGGAAPIAVRAVARRADSGLTHRQTGQVHYTGADLKSAAVAGFEGRHGLAGCMNGAPCIGFAPGLTPTSALRCSSLRYGRCPSRYL